MRFMHKICKYNAFTWSGLDRIRSLLLLPLLLGRVVRLARARKPTHIVVGLLRTVCRDGATEKEMVQRESSRKRADPTRGTHIEKQRKREREAEKSIGVLKNWNHIRGRQKAAVSETSAMQWHWPWFGLVHSPWPTKAPALYYLPISFKFPLTHI